MHQYFLGIKGEQSGPYSVEEVGQKIARGEVGADDLCWREGFHEWLPVSSLPELGKAAQHSALQLPPVSIPPPHVPRTPQPMARNEAGWLYIPMSRFVVLSIVSCGFYDAYWIYKNWQYIKRRESLDILPFFRGIFGIFFCHALLQRIYNDAASVQPNAPTFSPMGLATGWVVLRLLATALAGSQTTADSFWPLIVPSFLMFMPVQACINSTIAQHSPHAAHHPWSTGHFVCLFLGILAWAGEIL